MTPQAQLAAMIPAAYLVGSIPVGLLVGRCRGIDPRKAGSGNIGATNLGRLLGVKFFALVFSLDLLKGLVPTLIAGAVARRSPDDWTICLLWLAVGLAAPCGHMFSLFLGFQGGKGVATSLGFVLGVFPYFTWAGAVAATVWIVIFAATRYVSLASMIAAAAFLPAYIFIGLAAGWPLFGRLWPLLACAALIPAVIIYKHRANIERLRQGTESRIVRRGS